MHRNDYRHYVMYWTNIYQNSVRTSDQVVVTLCGFIFLQVSKRFTYCKRYLKYQEKLNFFTELDGNDFIKWCQEEHKVSAIPGVRFSYKENCHNFLRISIGFHKKEVLENASKILCKGLLQYIKKNLKN